MKLKQTKPIICYLKQNNLTFIWSVTHSGGKRPCPASPMTRLRILLIIKKIFSRRWLECYRHERVPLCVCFFFGGGGRSYTGNIPTSSSVTFYRIGITSQLYCKIAVLKYCSELHFDNILSSGSSLENKSKRPVFIRRKTVHLFRRCLSVFWLLRESILPLVTYG